MLITKGEKYRRPLSLSLPGAERFMRKHFTEWSWATLLTSPGPARLSDSAIISELTNYNYKHRHISSAKVRNGTTLFFAFYATTEGVKWTGVEWSGVIRNLNCFTRSFRFTFLTCNLHDH